MLSLDSFFEQFESDQLNWFTKHPKWVFWLIFSLGLLLVAAIFAILLTCCPLTLVSLSSGFLLGAALLTSMVILSCKIKDRLMACYHADIITGFYRCHSENNIDHLDEIFTERPSFLTLSNLEEKELLEAEYSKKRLNPREYIYDREDFQESTYFISMNQKERLDHSPLLAYILQNKDTFGMNTDSLLSMNKEEGGTKSFKDKDALTLNNTHFLSHFFEKNSKLLLQPNFTFTSRDAQRGSYQLEADHAKNSEKRMTA